MSVFFSSIRKARDNAALHTSDTFLCEGGGLGWNENTFSMYAYMENTDGFVWQIKL